MPTTNNDNDDDVPKTLSSFKKFKPQPGDPDTAPDSDDPDVEDALNQCDRILDAIDEIDKSHPFLEDVEAQVKRMSDDIEARGRVTPGQQRALDNWEKAVNKWRR